jgi:putative transposase
LDEVFVKVNGKLRCLWRVVDHEGEVLETVVTAKRDKAAALKFLKRITKKYRAPRSFVTDGLRAYPAAMNDRRRRPSRSWSSAQQSRGECAPSIRRRERARQLFRSARTLQKFGSIQVRSTIISTTSVIS